MTELEIANMLADYHKECDATDGLGDKGRIQLNHARKIMQALRLHGVSGQSELLKAFYHYIDMEWALGSLTDKVDEVIEGFKKSL